jgi:putative protease
MDNNDRELTQKRPIPKLLSPIRSYEGAVRVIRAGADEIYCGVISEIPSLKHFVLYRGVWCNLPTYEELGRVAKYAHDHGVKVLLTANLPFMIEAVEKEIKNYIRACLDEGIDALIIGDLGVLSMVKSMSVDIPLYASTYLATLNQEAVAFLTKMGFERVILERQLTIDEIAEIVQKSQVEIEVFIHGLGGCSHIDVSCYLIHAHFPELNRVRLMIDSSFNPPCKLPFEVYDSGNDQLRSNSVPILDAQRMCSICDLPMLIRTGVTGLKIEGRGNPAVFQESTTKLYRELLDLLERGQMTTYWKRVESLKRQFIPKPPYLQNLHESCCEQKRCYYSPFFHAPYKLPVSWHAWTKCQFKTLTMVKDDARSLTGVQE